MGLIGELVKPVKHIGEHQAMSHPSKVVCHREGMGSAQRVGRHRHIHCPTDGVEGAFIAGGFVPPQQNPEEGGLRPEFAVLTREVVAQVGGVDTQVAVSILGGQQAFNMGTRFRDEGGVLQEQGGAHHPVEPVRLGFTVPPQELDFPLAFLGDYAQLLGTDRFGQSVSTVDIVVQNQVRDERIQVTNEPLFQVALHVGAQPARWGDCAEAKALVGWGLRHG